MRNANISAPLEPSVDPDAFVASGTRLIGEVTVGAQSSIWFNCVLRADVQKIVIGERTNIQDGTIIHGTTGGLPVLVGNDVTVGHGAILHACTIEDGGFVGFGARVLDGAIVKSGGMLAAGSLLSPGKVVGSGELWAGHPARLVRPLTDKERDDMVATTARYVTLASRYKSTNLVIFSYQENQR
ncbi:gamma carbonic anhydrase family protein [Paraburkholderia silviterrae]|uniref:Gamma carbonic anhydrase family protein n=1 Tax=Paraburkholderia silviterrae TaxID=2528715 RepID=A0A4R5LYL7_9BURK|nr:gamma carbonic anhydrase family protein [Paraburkholderia silviterrae]